MKTRKTCLWPLFKCLLLGQRLCLLLAILFFSLSRSSVEASSIVLSPDATRIFVVNPDSDSVSAVNVQTQEKIKETYVGDDPRNLGLSPDGSRLYVISQGSATLTSLDTQTLSVMASMRVSAEPYDVVIDPEGRFAFVSSSALALIEVIDLSLNEVAVQIPVGPRPKGLALAADGSRLYATHFLSGDVSVVDPVTRSVVDVIHGRDDNNMAQRIVLHPTNGRAYLPHIQSNVGNTDLRFNNTVFPIVSVINLVTNQFIAKERIILSAIGPDTNLPFDIDFSPDGQQLYILHNGSGDILIVDLDSTERSMHIDVGDGPRGMVINPDGSTAYVGNSLSDDVSVVDLERRQEIKRIPVTTSPLSPQLKRGKLLFFSSRPRTLAFRRWISCASCHFEGEHDGRTWTFAAGPRNTTSMRGVGNTKPVHWSADRDEVQDFEFTIRVLQLGTGLIQDGEPNPELGPLNAGLSADLDALAAFTESLQHKPNPLRSPDGTLTSAALRGEIIFERADVGCLACHPPPYYTDSSLTASPFIVHSVGTGDSPDEHLGSAFDTPSLLGLWDSAPYLHDGSAPTLHDVITTANPANQHGQTTQLSETEINDLVSFLVSLEDSASRIQDLERLE